MCSFHYSLASPLDFVECAVPGRLIDLLIDCLSFLLPLLSNKLFTLFNLAHRSLSFASLSLSSSSAPGVSRPESATEPGVLIGVLMDAAVPGLWGVAGAPTER